MILKDLQQIVVESQVASLLLPKRTSPECGEPRCSKANHTLSVRTVFRRLTVTPVFIVVWCLDLPFKLNLVMEGDSILADRGYRWLCATRLIDRAGTHPRNSKASALVKP